MAAQAISSGLGAGLGIYQAIDAGNKKKSAMRALNNLPTPELTNVAKDLQVSTLGSDLRTQEAGRTTASAIDASRAGGARAIIGSVGAIQTQNDIVAQSNASNLDEQQKAIDQMKAEDEKRIQGITEQRYQNDVSALSSQINSSEDAKNQGIANAFQSIGSGGNLIGAKEAGTTGGNKFDTASNRRKLSNSVGTNKIS